MGEGNIAYIGSALISLVFLLGCIPAIYLVNRIGRRPLMIWGFVFMTISMFGLGLFPNANSWIIITFFCMFAIFTGWPGILEYVYPNELFPTDIRATAVGFATGISRIGAFLGTFGLPLSLAKYGVGKTMIISGVITLLGLLVSIAWALETKNRSLAEASAGDSKNNENQFLESSVNNYSNSE